VIKRPPGVPGDALAVPPTPFFWHVRDDTIVRVGAQVARMNAMVFEIYERGMSDWTLNDAHCRDQGIPWTFPPPTAPSYEVLIAVWTDTAGEVKAVAYTVPSPDPKLSAVVPNSMPSLPVEWTVYMWQRSVPFEILVESGMQNLLDSSLQRLLLSNENLK
jgi:hypothetical protein